MFNEIPNRLITVKLWSYKTISCFERKNRCRIRKVAVRAEANLCFRPRLFTLMSKQEVLQEPGHDLSYLV